jgi:hypothetical protein
VCVVCVLAGKEKEGGGRRGGLPLLLMVHELIDSYAPVWLTALELAKSSTNDPATQRRTQAARAFIWDECNQGKFGGWIVSFRRVDNIRCMTW